jgi:type VI secretion system secreted protein VgrG
MLESKTWTQDILHKKREVFASSHISSIGSDFHLRLGAFHEGDVRVAAFLGAEALNELYQFDVVFAVPAAEGARVPAMLGHDACLTIPHPGGARLVIGIASAIEVIEPREDGFVFRVSIVPRLWTLGHARRSRVYQNLTTAQIVAEVLTRYGVPHVFSLTAAYPPREYCLQYDETDLAFVLRLLADEGYVFTFEHWGAAEAQAAGFGRATECLMIGDDPRLYTPIEMAPPALTYKPDASASGWATEPVVRLISRTAIATNMVTHRDYDFTRAAPAVATRNGSPPGTTAGPAVWNGSFTTVERRDTAATAVDLEVYDHRAEERAPRQDVRRPRTRLEQLRRDTDVFHGATWCRRLLPGRRFGVLDYPLSAEPPDLTITRIFHASHTAKVGSETRYEAEFEAVRSDVLYRPPAPPRRSVQTVESATVVGPPGQDVDTEIHGRVHVQFHWDREGNNDDHSSCWIRVAQTWSGPTYGFQFVPRIGSEVLVAFLGGDPDHPVIVGSLPNTANRLPHLLPQDASRSAIRTFSMPPTGGYNEILFIDRAGGELFSMRAERDQETVVLNDHRLDVGHDATTTIAERRTTRVGGADDLTVAGSASRSVAGASVDAVGGGRAERVGGTASLAIGGGWIVTVDGMAEHTVSGSLRTVVGSGEQADAITAVNGEYRVAASKLLELRSEETLRLIVGSTVVELTPKGISIQADTIDAAVKEALTATGRSVRVAAKDTLELEGMKVNAAAAGASLALDTIAWLDGANVCLNCRGIKPKPIIDGPPPPKGKVTFRVEPPPDMEGPFTMVISTPTGKIVEVETDSDNKVELEGLEEEEFTLVAVKKGPLVLQQLGEQLGDQDT